MLLPGELSHGHTWTLEATETARCSFNCLFQRLLFHYYMGVSRNGGTPSYHPFLIGSFPHKQSILGYPRLWTPHISDDGP